MRRVLGVVVVAFAVPAFAQTSAPAPASASIEVVTEAPEAKVFVDGKLEGKRAVPKRPIAPGNHVIKVVYPSGKTFEQKVTLAPRERWSMETRLPDGTTVRRELTPEPTPAAPAAPAPLPTTAAAAPLPAPVPVPVPAAPAPVAPPPPPKLRIAFAAPKSPECHDKNPCLALTGSSFEVPKGGVGRNVRVIFTNKCAEPVTYTQCFPRPDGAPICSQLTLASGELAQDFFPVACLGGSIAATLASDPASCRASAKEIQCAP